MGKTTLNSTVLEDVYLMPIFGGDPDDQDPDDKDPDNQDPDDGDDDGDDDEDRSKWTPDQIEKHELRGEAARRRKEKIAEKKRADAAEARVKELESAGKSAEEKLKADLQEALDRADKLTAAGTRNVLRTAIMEHDKFRWHDVGDVMKELNMDDLDVNVEDHEVEGLESQLKDLAKRKPYLLKKSSEEEEEGSVVTKTPRTPSGTNPGRRKPAPKKEDREALLNKYSVLKNR